jgi:hypothetical protein
MKKITTGRRKEGRKKQKIKSDKMPMLALL